jgi:hypothetical protein
MKIEVIVMPAWMAGIQARRDASGNIHVNLGPGSPCRDDEPCYVSVTQTKLTTMVPHPSQIF